MKKAPNNILQPHSPDLPTVCEIGSGLFPYNLKVVIGVVNHMIALRLVKKYLDTRAPLNKLLSPNTREFEKRLNNLEGVNQQIYGRGTSGSGESRHPNPTQGFK